MKKSYLFPFTALTILVLGIAFYWYEVRPSSIRIECQRTTQGQSTQSPDGVDPVDYKFMMAKKAQGMSFDDAKAALVQAKEGFYKQEYPGISLDEINKKERDKRDILYKDCINNKGLK